MLLTEQSYRCGWRQALRKTIPKWTSGPGTRSIWTRLWAYISYNKTLGQWVAYADKFKLSKNIYSHTKQSSKFISKTFKVNKADPGKVTITSGLYRRLCPYRVSNQNHGHKTATYKGPKTGDIQIYRGSILLAQVFYLASVSDLPSSLQKDNIRPTDKTDYLGTCMNLHTHGISPVCKTSLNSLCFHSPKTTSTSNNQWYQKRISSI